MYEELIKRLRHDAGQIRKGSAFFTAKQADLWDEAADAIEKLVLELDKASNSGGKTSWIPVTERLPEKDGPVLVYYGFDHGNGFGKMFTQVLDYYATDRMPRFQNEGMMNLKVTHWMPLPKPPKEETE